MIRLSYHTSQAKPDVFEKNSKHGWQSEEFEWDEQQLKELCENKPYSHLTWNNGERHGDNIQDNFNVIAIDVDNDTKKNPKTMTLSEMIQWLERKQLNYFLITSKSHSATQNKFRVLLPTEEPYHPEDLQKIKHYFIEIENIPVDTQCFDAARFWHKSNSKTITAFEHNKLNFDVSSLAEPSTTKKFNFKDVDDNEFSVDLEVRLDDGTIEKVINIMNDHQPIYCPFHDDWKNGRGGASAFVEPRPNGGCHIHCKSCGKTWFSKDAYVRNPQNPIKILIDDTTGKIVRIDERPDAYTRIKVFNDNGVDFPNYAITQLKWNEKQVRNKRNYLTRVIMPYDPNKPTGYFKHNDEEFYNTHKDSKYVSNLQHSQPKNLPHNIKQLKSDCPTITDILLNILDDDEKNLEYFTNYFACLVQKKAKPQTGWIISTQQGAGKDAMFKEILSPILGKENTLLKEMKTFDDNFMPHETLRLIGINETGTRSFLEDKHVIEQLKNMVTEERRRIRKMRTDEFYIDNHVVYMLFSNSKSPLPIQDNDRRFYYVRAGKSKEWFAYSWFKDADFNHVSELIKSELPKFAEYLYNLKVDVKLTTKAPLTLHKQGLINTNLSPMERLSKAVAAGKVEDWDEWEDLLFDSENPRIHWKDGDPTSNFDRNDCAQAVTSQAVIPAKYRKIFLPIFNRNSTVASHMWREHFETGQQSGIGKVWKPKE